MGNTLDNSLVTTLVILALGATRWWCTSSTSCT